MLVTKDSELKDVCEKIRSAKFLALDTEFVSERSYYPELGVVQLAGDGVVAVVDPQEVESLDPIYDLITDPEVEVIVHAGRSDFEIIYDRTGAAPANVFDSQVAAAFLGYGSQISLVNLLKKVVRVDLKKDSQLTDWTRRPLTKKQLDYALDDVRHLRALRDSLVKQLEKKGRDGWVKEECRLLEREGTYQRTEPDEVYLSMNARGLNRREKTILRELASWREREAIRLNKPKGYIAKDPILVQIAKQKPQSLDELRSMRFMGGNKSRERADGILGAVKAGIDGPQIKVDRGEGNKPPPPQAQALQRLLSALVQSRALESEIAASLLAKTSHLAAICSAHFRGEEAEVPMFKGWRRELIGEDVLALLAGRSSLGVDPKTGNLIQKS